MRVCASINKGGGYRWAKVGFIGESGQSTGPLRRAVNLSGIITVTMVAGVFAFDLPSRDDPYLAKSVALNDISKIGTVISMAETSDSFIAKSIIVENGPPDIEVQPRLFSEKLFSDVDDVSALSHFSSWRNRILSFCIADIDWKIVQSVILTEFIFNEPLDFSGRQISNVTNVNMSYASIGITQGMDALRFDTDIGTLENFGVASLPIDSPSGDTPETNGRNSQDGGETDKPKREVSNRIAVRLFPKPVLLALLYGTVVGCIIVIGTILLIRKQKR
jgi:hypothetical protein